MKSHNVEPTTIEKLKNLAQLAEQVGHLLPEQLEIIYQNKWFKIFVPAKFGGLQMSLPDALRLEENLARIDGSLGWTVTLCAGANMFVGYMDLAFAETIFYNEKICLGGSGAASGIAQITDDGFVINGLWKYATGAPHLTHFTANCKLKKDDKFLVDEKGLPHIRSFVFKKEEVNVIEDWNTMGLKATASNSFEVNDLKVAKERAFIIDDKNVFVDAPVYRYPFLQLAETTLAVNCLGMAELFLDEVTEIFKNKVASKKICIEQFERLQKQISFAENFLQKNKEQFYAKVDESWEQLTKQNTIDAVLLERISFLSKGIAKSTRELVTEVYPLCGISATENGTALNRVFRDIFTGSQHSLLNA